MSNQILHSSQAESLKTAIQGWGAELGFGAVGFSGIELPEAEAQHLDWLAKGYHGEMDYMARHGTKRTRPAELVPGTCTVITARIDYLPANHPAEQIIEQSELAYVSRYALGRDYHKVVRNKLQKLAERIADEVGHFSYRVFTDSAPVLEVALAARSSLGWRGKHTLLLHREAGSWFFLGEIYCDLELPPDPPEANHCGTCQACMSICPTQAIVAPYEVDARRCISYLTIELQGSIPVELRPLLGNRIYGCDDCQLTCPWNRFAQITREPDFAPRNNLDTATLVELFTWTEQEFDRRLAGSPIRRIGHERWLRNIAVALGNGPVSSTAKEALVKQLDHSSAMVREHVAWALHRLESDRNEALT